MRRSSSTEIYEHRLSVVLVSGSDSEYEVEWWGINELMFVGLLFGSLAPTVSMRGSNVGIDSATSWTAVRARARVCVCLCVRVRVRVCACACVRGCEHKMLRRG